MRTITQIRIDFNPEGDVIVYISNKEELKAIIYAFRLGCLSAIENFSKFDKTFSALFNTITSILKNFLSIKNNVNVYDVVWQIGSEDFIDMIYDELLQAGKVVYVIKVQNQKRVLKIVKI